MAVEAGRTERGGVGLGRRVDVGAPEERENHVHFNVRTRSHLKIKVDYPLPLCEQLHYGAVPGSGGAPQRRRPLDRLAVECHGA